MNEYMNEMLANKYFLSLEFDSAIEIYEKLIREEKAELDILPKLIICYVAVGKVDTALSWLEEVIHKNPSSVLINENLKNGLCPCYEIISKIETKRIKYEDEYMENKALGILWLYCDYERGIYYLSEAEKVKSDLKLNALISILEKEITSNKYGE